MKNHWLLSLFIVCLFVHYSVIAQDSSRYSYKMIALDKSGNPICNDNLKVRLSIISDFSSGITDYQEQFNLKSDNKGLLILKIGTGIERIGKLQIPFHSGNNSFLKIEIYDEMDNAFWISSFGQLFSSEEQDINSGHYIGEKFGGGIVFYIDEMGNYGLIAQTTDLSDGEQWGCKKSRVGAGDLLDGERNTKLIVEKCKGAHAAGICAFSNVGGFNDWYLPSQHELRLMYEQRVKIGGFAAGDYCSSTEYRSSSSYRQDPIDCWVIQFGREGRLIHYHKDSYYYVRAIRKF